MIDYIAAGAETTFFDTLRTAAFVKAINQIGVSYLNMGIFPWK